MGALVTTRCDRSAGELAARSRGWAPPAHADAALVIGAPSDEALVLGAFQRKSELSSDAPLPLFRRGSGGGVVRVGRGSLWLQLVLVRPDALVACSPDKLLNR